MDYSYIRATKSWATAGSPTILGHKCGPAADCKTGLYGPMAACLRQNNNVGPAMDHAVGLSKAHKGCLTKTGCS